MESIVCPIKSWDAFPKVAKDLFKAIRSDAGEEMILKNNIFVERMLPNNIRRALAQEELDAYNMPYKEEGESRRPTLTWPREVPIKSDGPWDVVKIVTDYGEYLSRSNFPKLYIEADSGLASKDMRKIAKDWPNTKTVEVAGLHFAQEDSPDAIGTEIKFFVEKL